MKKILSLLLVLTCCLSAICMFSCDGDDSTEKVSTINGITPYEAFVDSFNEMGNLITDPNAYIEIKMDMGTLIKVDMIMYDTEFVIEMNQPSADMNIAYVDEYVYLNYSSQKTKTALSKDDAHEQFAESFMEEFDINMEDSELAALEESGLFDNVKFTKKGSKYSLSVDLVKLSKLPNADDYEEILEDIENFDKAIFSMEFDKEGKLTKLEYALKGTSDGTTIDMSMIVSDTPGANVSKIKAPKDADSYVLQ